MKMINANGASIPGIGLGTWTLKDEEATRLVAHALDAGYRHIDTAAMYANEKAVGAGLRASGVPREEIFVTTKVWYTDIADGDLQQSAEASLERLDIDDVDLMLIHWPSADVPLAESIRALNEVQEYGLARSIGVSNFPVALLERAISMSDNPLVCNQVEYHPFLDQSAVLRACRAHGMAVVSYCPLCRGSELFEQAAVRSAANKYNRTPAQIVLRWHVQQDSVAAIPRSQTPARIIENLNVFNFELTADEMAAISALRDRNKRICQFDFGPSWDPPEL
ncbi:MAG: aldo/keto reductase [Hyphomicrobiales bacterium]|nr:aldo/keto reductase [Hyphomicrobiales bacterium]